MGPFSFPDMLRLSLCSHTGSISDKVLWAAKKNMYSLTFGWAILWDRSIWLVTLLKVIALLYFLFCSNGVSFSISATLYLFVCLEVNLKPCVPLIVWSNLFTSQCFGLKSILSDITLAIPAFFLVLFAWNIVFHPFISKWDVFDSEICSGW